VSAPSVGAIIVAAGNSRRMGGIDKLWLDLGGQPLLARTIAAITATPGLTQVVVVASDDTLLRVRPLANQPPWSAVQRWVPGGPTRQDSVFAGIESLDSCELLLIHDGARPLVSPEVLSRAVATAIAHDAAIATGAVTDTIKIVNEHGRVVDTLDRGVLRAAQTPQVFAYPLIRAAYARVGQARANCTDDAAIAQLAGFSVFTFPGDPFNMKVSTPADVAVVRSLWALRELERRG